MSHLSTCFRVLAAGFALAGALFAAPAQAQTSTLSFVSQPGDWVGAGQTLSFSNGITASASSDNRVVGVSVYSGDHWFYLDLAAPVGQALAVGTYTGATRYPFNDTNEPGLSFSGDGRGCNTLTGTFEIVDIEFGPYGYVQKLRANWEQHCEGGTPALFGQVDIVNPAPPSALTIDVRIDPRGAVNRGNGTATIRGTVTCSSDTSVYLNGAATQRAGRFALAQGAFSTQAACSTTPTAWTATVSPNVTPFNQGTAQVDVHASGFDPNYGSFVQADASGVVHLTGTKGKQ